jgi:hypothetical protein
MWRRKNFSQLLGACHLSHRISAADLALTATGLAALLQRQQGAASHKTSDEALAGIN